MQDSNLQAIQTHQRIDIIDAVRGIAILGVLLVSINSFGRPERFFLNFTLDHESGINYYVWWVVQGVFAGSMRALFSILFGTSTIILLYRLENGKRPLSAADIYYRRMLILLGFAMINGFVLLWYADILYSYAICGLFLFPFRHLKASHLLVIGLVLLLIPGITGTYKMHKRNAAYKKAELTAISGKDGQQPVNGQSAVNGKWPVGDDAAADREVAQEQRKRMLQGYFSVAKYNISRTISAQSNHFYKVGFFDVMPFFFIGMALFKLGILSGERSKRFYWILLITGFGIGLGIAFYLLKGYASANFESNRYAEYIMADLYQEKRLFLAMGFIGLIMLFYKYGLAKGPFNVLAKVGQMTLTNYMMQAAICAVIFYGFGLGLFGSLERYQLYFVVIGIWIFQIVFSNNWMRMFRYGPIEWMWRSLTYWKWQGIRREGFTESFTQRRKEN